MKQNDTKDLVITCTDGGEPVDLTAASEVRVVAEQNGVLLFSRVASGSNMGVVTFTIQSTDSAAVGVVHVEVQATFPGSPPKVWTFPEDGYLTFFVTPELNGATPPLPGSVIGVFTEDPAHPGLYLMGG